MFVLRYHAFCTDNYVFLFLVDYFQSDYLLCASENVSFRCQWPEHASSTLEAALPVPSSSPVLRVTVRNEQADYRANHKRLPTGDEGSAANMLLSYVANHRAWFPNHFTIFKVYPPLAESPGHNRQGQGLSTDFLYRHSERRRADRRGAKTDARLTVTGGEGCL